ncbi:hypothetical protein [Actinophytocola sp.]|uniref:hypothetical protein n=1 Tax=Actinophytocola sp. TaxID=1872138 RepID=UPI002ED09C04
MTETQVSPRQLWLFAALTVVMIVVLCFSPGFGILSLDDRLGKDQALLDPWLGYRAGEAWNVLDTLGPDGRDDLRTYYWVDFAFAVCYGVLLWVTIHHLAIKSPWRERTGMRTALCSLAALAAVCDIIENILVLVALGDFPAPNTLGAAGVFGLLKFLLVIFAVIVVLCGLLSLWAGRHPTETTQCDTVPVKQTFVALRAGSAFLLVLLTISIVVEIFLHELHKSISDFYYSPTRAVFVGGLCAIGVCLIINRAESDLENAMLDGAGLMAFVVAFVPVPRTNPDVWGKLTDGEVLDATGNNLSALFATAATATVFGFVSTELLRGKREKPLPPFAKVLLGALLTLLVGAGILGAITGSQFFVDNAHGFAAGVLFAFIMAVVMVNAAADKRSESSKASPNLVLVAVMIASVLGWLPWGSYFDYDDWFFWLEASLLTCFAIFWVIQTQRLNGTMNGVRSGAARSSTSSDATESEPSPSVSA